MRLFIGIPLPDDLQKTLREEWLKMESPNRPRPVRRGNLHLTLAFLDEVPESKLETLQELIKKAVANPPSGSFSIVSFETFPKRKPLRIIARAEPDKEAEWKKFVHDIRDIVSILAPKIDRRPWVPHISISRAYRGTCLEPWFQEIGPYDWQAENIAIIRSKLTPEGSIYTVLHEFPLNF